jgi:hypothetical protein
MTIPRSTPHLLQLRRRLRAKLGQPYDREGIAEIDDFAGRSNAHSVWVTFWERDEGK